MKNLKETIAGKTEPGFRRDSHAEAAPWDLIYQTLVDELDLRVEDAVARALSEHGLAPPPIGGVVINTRKNRFTSSVLGPATQAARETRRDGGSQEDPRRSGGAFGSALPPWLQPFAHPDTVRFTRTPDSFLRPGPVAAEAAQEPPEPMPEAGHDRDPEPGDAAPFTGFDAETLMNAGTPSWRIPVTLPPNVRFNRTPLRRTAEEILPPEPVPDARAAANPVLEGQAAAEAFFLEVSEPLSFLEDARARPAARAEREEPRQAPATAVAAAPQPQDLRLEETAAGDPYGAQSDGLTAPLAEAAAPAWFDFFGGSAAEKEPDDVFHPDESRAFGRVSPALAATPALLMLPAPSAPWAAPAEAPAAEPQTYLPEAPAWYEFFGADLPIAADEQDNVGQSTEAGQRAETTAGTEAAADHDTLPLVDVVFAMPDLSTTVAIGTLEGAAADAPLPGASAAASGVASAPQAAPAVALAPPQRPTGIASPEDARASAGPPRDFTIRKPTAAPHGLAPFDMTNAITSGTDLWEDPPLELLVEPPAPRGEVLSSGALEQNARLLEGVLEEFGIRGEIIDVRPGPVVTLYEFEPAPGTKSSRVIGLSDDIARSMSAVSARVAVVQGRNVIGIELPNQVRETVFLSELISSSDFLATKHKLAIALGKTIGGEPIIVDLTRMPHLLVAGTTGSGKSVAINTMILSILYRLRPEECRLIMVDPKMLELSVYEGIPHLLTPVVTDPKKAVVALKWAVREMEDRYKKMSKVGVRNIDGFNARVAEANAKDEAITRTIQTGYNRETGQPIFETEEMILERLPYIVVVVDEMADLMMVAGKDIEGAIQRLAQMARAAGIHLIMATQRPSVDVITGTIKANFPTRISFQVTSKIDSRTILGEQGAEQLLGQGDMLYMAGGGRISRVHGPFVSDGEVEKVVAHLKRQGHPAYLDVVVADEDGGDGKADAGDDKPVFERGSAGSDDDGELYDQAVKVVLRDKKCSTSYIQRRLQVGYNKAASLVERMEKEGIVGQANNAGKREILVYSRDLRYTETRREGDE